MSEKLSYLYLIRSELEDAQNVIKLLEDQLSEHGIPPR